METKPTKIIFEFVSCALCGENNASVKYRIHIRDLLSQSTVVPAGITEDYITLVECRKCGLVYVNPRWIFSEGIMPYSEEAEESYFDATYATRKITYTDLVKRIRSKYNIPTYRALDVGCGDGLLLEICQQAGIECDGFEISDSLVRKLRSRFGKETIHNGNLEMLPEKTYDIVFLINVIEHLPDPVITLAQIHRILKPGGITFIHAPNYGGLPAKLLGPRWHQIAPLAHLYYFNDRTIEGILRKSGFQPDGNFYLTSKSVLKKTAQQILSFLDIRLDNGLGVIARRPKS